MNFLGNLKGHIPTIMSVAHAIILTHHLRSDVGFNRTRICKVDLSIKNFVNNYICIYIRILSHFSDNI